MNQITNMEIKAMLDLGWEIADDQARLNLYCMESLLTNSQKILALRNSQINCITAEVNYDFLKRDDTNNNSERTNNNFYFRNNYNNDSHISFDYNNKYNNNFIYNRNNNAYTNYNSSNITNNFDDTDFDPSIFNNPDNFNRKKSNNFSRFTSNFFPNNTGFSNQRSQRFQNQGKQSKFTSFFS